MVKITVVAMGNKMPLWVTLAVQEFSKRLHDPFALTLLEIPCLKRGKSSDLSRILDKESASMLALIPEGSYAIALDIQGSSWSSEALAEKLGQLPAITNHLCFLIGGPEGLSTEVLQRSQERWSLSKLTLPHPLARIVLLEALYRAWTISTHHPYHK